MADPTASRPTWLESLQDPDVTEKLAEARAALLEALPHLGRALEAAAVARETYKANLTRAVGDARAVLGDQQHAPGALAALDDGLSQFFALTTGYEDLHKLLSVVSETVALAYQGRVARMYPRFADQSEVAELFGGTYTPEVMELDWREELAQVREDPDGGGDERPPDRGTPGTSSARPGGGVRTTATHSAGSTL